MLVGMTLGAQEVTMNAMYRLPHHAGVDYCTTVASQCQTLRELLVGAMS